MNSNSYNDFGQQALKPLHYSAKELVDKIVKTFKLQPPQNPLSLEFIAQALKQMFPDFLLIANNQKERWIQLIRFLQNQIIDGKLELPKLKRGIMDKQQIGEILMLLAELSQIIPQKTKQIFKKQKKNNNNKSYNKPKQKKSIQQIYKNAKYSQRDKQSRSKQRLSQGKQTKIRSQQKPKHIDKSIKENKKSKPNNKNEKYSANQMKKYRPYTAKLDAKTNLQEEVLKSVQQVLNKKVNRDRKTNPIMRDHKGDQAVNKAKRIFDYELKQYARQGRKKHKDNQAKNNSYPQKKKSSGGVDQAFFKMLERKHKNLEEQVVNQQLKYYLDLREKKLSYIRNIHKLLTNLEKERQIDYDKKIREKHMEQKKAIKQQIEATENIFSGNLQHLKQQYHQRKQAKQIEVHNELDVCRLIQRQVTKKKKDEMDFMKTLWSQQNMKLKAITGDEEKIQAKFLKIYRKSRV